MLHLLVQAHLVAAAEDGEGSDACALWVAWPGPAHEHGKSEMATGARMESGSANGCEPGRIRCSLSPRMPRTGSLPSLRKLLDNPVESSTVASRCAILLPHSSTAISGSFLSDNWLPWRSPGCRTRPR